MSASSRNIPTSVIPEPTMRRLPWYLVYVSRIKASGVEFVSSTQISKDINVDSSIIAKDLSHLDIKGKTRIGYDVATLERTLQDFLGFKKMHNAVIFGVGSLGSLLLQDSGLHEYGLNIVAGFDVSESVVGSSIGGAPIYHLDRLGELLPSLKADIGVVTVPADHAQEVCDLIVGSGIHALWNFTPVRITVPEGIVIQNTSIYAHLALIYNRLGLIKSGRR